MAIVNVEFPDGTWLEGEEFCYPSGGMKRRAYAAAPTGRNDCSKPGSLTRFLPLQPRAGV